MSITEATPGRCIEAGALVAPNAIMYSLGDYQPRLGAGGLLDDDPRGLK